MLTDDNRSNSTANALANWFHGFQTNIPIDEENLHCLTSNPNLQDIWQKIIRHCHPIDHVKKVKETLRIEELKERHPDQWEQHKNAQIQQSQIEQRIQLRLREIYSLKTEQSTNVFNELNRVETMINDEYQLISSLDKQLQIYRQILTDLNQLSQIKQQLNLFFSSNNQQGSMNELLNTKSVLTDKYQQSININDLCSMMNNQIQQRINQLNKIEKDDQETNSPIIHSYEDALTKTNLDFTKQFVHLANIRLECAKLRHRLEESKREVLSRRSSSEQNQLLIILDAMIASKSIENHLNSLKKKVQTELEQTKKSDEKTLSHIHQQITEKRNDLNRIDQQLNQIIQQNPLEKLEKLELKIRDYTRLINDLPQHIHSLNILHLSLSNELRSNLLTWSNEEFHKINLTNETIIQSSPVPLPLPIIPSQTPTTPLTSLKQLLGIRTQDTTILEPTLTNDFAATKEENQHWDIEGKDEDMLTMKYPIISSIDWQMLSRVDKQIEDSLKECQGDMNQYDEIFQKMLKEIRVLQHEQKEKPAFRL